MDNTDISAHAPPGINDKTHGQNLTDAPYHPYDYHGPYTLVPPFLIGASTVICVYIVVHCLYLHCWTKKNMKKIAERQFPPALVISDDFDQTSRSSISGYSPLFRGADSSDGGQHMFLYQVIDEDEWERQLALRRKSSVAGPISRKSSLAFDSLRKKSVSLQIPAMFGKRSSISVEQDGKRPKRGSICMVPVVRSLHNQAHNADYDNEVIALNGLGGPAVVRPRTQGYSTQTYNMQTHRSALKHKTNSSSSGQESQMGPPSITITMEKEDIPELHAMEIHSSASSPALSIIGQNDSLTETGTPHGVSAL